MVPIRSANRALLHHVRAAWVALLVAGCGVDSRGSDAAMNEDAASDPDAAELGPPCEPADPVCGLDAKCTATRWRLAEPWPAPRCAAPGTGTRGDTCFALEGVFDGCDTDHACTNFGTGEGFCVPLCRADAPCAAAEDACVVVDPSSGFALCLTRCETDDDCAAPGFLACVEHDGVRVCDAAPP